MSAFTCQRFFCHHMPAGSEARRAGECPAATPARGASVRGLRAPRATEAALSLRVVMWSSESGQSRIDGCCAAPTSLQYQLCIIAVVSLGALRRLLRLELELASPMTLTVEEVGAMNRPSTWRRAVGAHKSPGAKLQITSSHLSRSWLTTGARHAA